MKIAHWKPGQVFGRLTVIHKTGLTKWKETRVLCRCSCGIEKEFTYKVLVRGDTKSCGCIQREHPNATTHGKCKSRAYYCWRNMLNRCYWRKSKSYPDYGGRGIRVCARWREDFELFYQDMGDPPAGATIERKNVNGHYTKDNCYWATRMEQGKNRRNNRWITFQGRTLHLSEWSRITGIKITTIKMRLDQYGWPIERALCA